MRVACSKLQQASISLYYSKYEEASDRYEGIKWMFNGVISLVQPKDWWWDVSQIVTCCSTLVVLNKIHELYSSIYLDEI
jgi:hypothetical protein